MQEGIIDGVGGLEETLAYIDEFKLTTKLEKGVYGHLKSEMWRETVGYLERWGDEANRDFAADTRRRRESEESKKRVQTWQAKSKL